MRLSLYLLGPFLTIIGDQAISETRTKRIEALLTYLVVESERGHRRETLMGLLFPEMANDVASNNLRQTLTRLRHIIGDREASDPFLTITRESIQFNRKSNYWCDLIEFEELVLGCAEHKGDRQTMCSSCMRRTQKGLDLYRGPFLENIFLSDSVTFEEWAAILREKLKQKALAALEVLTTFHMRRGEYEQAIIFGQRQLELEPWREEVHQLLIRLFARIGRRAQALAQYQSCARVLQDELDVEPSSSTKALREQIVNLKDTRPYNLPYSSEVFIGRDSELARIYRYFTDNSTRLLTIVGPGGIGKTRLALEVGWRIANDYLGPFMHGIYFISLAKMTHLGDAERAFAMTIADSIEISLLGSQSPLDIVLGFIQDKELLLIIDNCEEASNAIMLISQLLNHAPGLQILATSREPLKLANEYLLRIDGLPFPPRLSTADWSPPLEIAGNILTNADLNAKANIHMEDIESFQSVQLFSHHAQRINTGFSIPQLEQNEHQAIARICQICEGMPLALGMAAIWTQSLPCAEIANELEHNIDILRNQQLDSPERHRSIRAVFDYSWQRLTEDEQKLFARLSVFEGYFDLGAVQEVTDARLSVLASLVSKSLLHFVKIRSSKEEKANHQARYTFHPLLHQYGAEKLASDSEEDTYMQQQHSIYYCTWLQEQAPLLKGSEQQKGITIITFNFDNIRKALQWAVANEQEELISQAVEGLADISELRGQFSEGKELLQQAVERLEIILSKTEETDTAIVMAKVMARLGRLNFLLGHSTESQKQLEQSIDILKASKKEEALTTPLNHLAYLAYCTDQYELGLELSHEASELATKHEDQLAVADAYRTRAAIMQMKGDIAEGMSQYEKALAMYQQIGNHQGICWSLLSLSSCASKIGDYETAILRAEEVVRFSRQIEFRLVEGWALYALGCIYVRLCDYSTAYPIFEQALQVGRSINDRRQQASVLNRMGTCNHYQGALDIAEKYYEETVTICRQIGNQLDEGHALNDLGILARNRKNYLACRALCRQALDIGRNIGNKDLQRRAYTSLGHLYVAQKRYRQAKKTYERGLGMVEEVQPQWRLHPFTGLALIAIHDNDVDRAKELIESILSILEIYSIDGAEEPHLLRHTIHHVLHSLKDSREKSFLETYL